MSTTDFEPIPKRLIDDFIARLAENRPVKETLPGGGTLNMDRLLPFLCVYRRNPQRADAGTEQLVTAEASYLSAPGAATRRKGLRQLIRRIVETASSRLGSFLILEIWSGEDRDVPQRRDDVTGEPLLPGPAFRILTRRPHRPEGTVAKLQMELQRIKINRLPALVDIDLDARNHPPHLAQLISQADAVRLKCHVLGLEIRPVYRDSLNGEVYAAILQSLHRSLGLALKKTFFTFSLNRTNVRPQHYFVLGRKSLPSRVWNVDRQLAEVSSQFKFLLLVTPINAERAWHTFSENGYRKEPRFQYRPLETDPLLLKRRLLSIRTEEIEDPTLAHLFRQTQDELDRQITMLADVATRRFLPGSVQVYQGVEPPLLELAHDLLGLFPHSDDEGARGTTSAKEFARRANREIRHYQRQMNSFVGRAIVREDMYSGLLTTGGNLFVGRETALAEDRVEALIQHEVGTHLVTYYNGQAQPLRLLKVGLAGYDGLQEGLAVLSEYLVGGLSRGRMRTLAGRVVATDQMVAGSPFSETFRLLVEEYGFEPRTAFTITLRVYRGGGLTKDAVYLRGLVQFLEYARRSDDLEPLFVGKLAADHIPIIRELLLRGVLRKPALRPRYLDDPAAIERLERVRKGMTVLDLLKNQ